MGNFCAGTAGVWRMIGYIIYVIRIVIPIIIILLGTIDLGKAVIAGEDKKVKEAQKAFIMRIVYGVAIFFVFTIVEVIFGVLGIDFDRGDPKICWDCATKPNSDRCISYTSGEEYNFDNTIEEDVTTTTTTTKNTRVYKTEEA